MLAKSSCVDIRLASECVLVGLKSETHGSWRFQQNTFCFSWIFLDEKIEIMKL